MWLFTQGELIPTLYNAIVMLGQQGVYHELATSSSVLWRSILLNVAFVQN